MSERNPAEGRNRRATRQVREEGRRATGDAAERAPTSRTSLWSGRFAEGPCESLKAIGDSLRVDRRLVLFDLRASAAHARMLGERRIIPGKDARKIAAECRRIERELLSGKLRIEGPDEDVHSWIERVLTERIGEAGRRVHTARSRNDQVATAFRMWLAHEVQHAREDVDALARALLDQAQQNLGVVVPAYTHLQRGQPVLLSHQLLAYVEAVEHARWLLYAAADDTMQNCPLGSGAATGVPYPVDRESVAAACGFRRPAPNSMHAVADRAFAIQSLAALAVVAVEISRLAEDVCLWASAEWRLLELGDEVSTGSSIMPQKRNPDAAELTRGKTGRVIGHLTGLLTTLKGLPMTYNRDLQEDKEAVFDAVDTVRTCLHAMTDTIARSRFRPEAAEALLRRGHLLATELADFLVGKGVPFRDAHEVVGRVVRTCDEREVDLSDLSEEDLAAFDARFEGCAKALDFRRAVDRRDHVGGTATRRVKAALAAWKKRLA